MAKLSEQTAPHSSEAPLSSSGRRSSIPPESGMRPITVVDFPVGLQPVTAVRGTILVSSMNALRELGLFEHYRSLLPADIASDLLFTMAGVWIPITRAMAHYQACEALGLHGSMQVEIGRRAGERVHHIMLGSAERLLCSEGATPWSLLTAANRIWKRAFGGGGLRVGRISENDAYVEAYGNPVLNQITFCRNSFRGFCFALYGCMAERMSIREARITATQVDYRVFWK